MDTIQTICPSCRMRIEIPRDFESVICTGCGVSYEVREYGGTVGLVRLSESEGGGSNGSRSESIEVEVARLDEEMGALSSEIDELRSLEQSAPLQAGCALFGIFGMLVIVIAFFMTVAMNYFGSWQFYLALAAVVVLGLLRLRRKVASRSQIERLRGERERIESRLSALEAERRHLLDNREQS